MHFEKNYFESRLNDFWEICEFVLRDIIGQWFVDEDCAGQKRNSRNECDRQQNANWNWENLFGKFCLRRSISLDEKIPNFVWKIATDHSGSTKLVSNYRVGFESKNGNIRKLPTVWLQN